IWGSLALHGETFLVHEGEPQAVIILAENPARMSRLAARELQDHVKKITGAELPIGTKPAEGKVSIFVGVSPGTEALGLTVDDLRHGAFRMVSGDSWFALLGPDGDYTP